MRPINPELRAADRAHAGEARLDSSSTRCAAHGGARDLSSHPAKQHLAGDLTRISMPTVLMVCELERATGILQLKEAVQSVSCYVIEGRLVDVESAISADPKQALAAVLDWQSGSFEFLFQPVTRDDRIGMPVSALLLTLMHLRDEQLR